MVRRLFQVGVRHGVRAYQIIVDDRFIQFALASCYAVAHKQTQYSIIMKVYIERNNISGINTIR